MKSSYKYEDLREALYHAQDMFERCSLKVFLTEDTLLDAAKDTITKPPTFGTTREDVHEHAVKYLRQLHPELKVLVKKGGIITKLMYEFRGVPVTVKVYGRDDSNVRLQPKQYMYEWWDIPNPIDKYLPPQPTSIKDNSSHRKNQKVASL